MRKIVAHSPAKLNLTLDVVGELPDGYHQILTLFQAIDLQDELMFTLEPAQAVEIVIACANGTTKDFPRDDSNLIVRAARLFLSSMPKASGLKLTVTVTKKIPVAAGLAGGSGNAAATLLALNYYFGHLFGLEELHVLASKLGADVPFCLEGGTCIGHARGDELTVVKHPARLFFNVIKPRDLSISTAWVYEAFDEFAGTGDIQRPDLHGAVEGLQQSDLNAATRCFGNVFEPLVFSHYPQLIELKQHLVNLGCWCCHLTGSGPALYTVVADREMAHFVRRKLLDEKFCVSGGSEVDCFIAESINHGARLVDEG